MAAASAAERPAGDLVKDLSEQVSRLVRDELNLAQVEMTAKGKRAGAGAGLLGGSGLLALHGAAGCWPSRWSGGAGPGRRGERAPADRDLAGGRGQMSTPGAARR
jgi:hypothetical protein